MLPRDEAFHLDHEVTTRPSRAVRGASRTWTSLAACLFLSGAMVAFSACNPDADADAAAEGDESAEYESPAERAEAIEQPRVLSESSFEAATDADLNVDGTLEVVDRNGTVELNVRLQGLPPGEHAWHIHEGACDAAGAVRLALSSTSDMEGDVGPITVDAQGMVERTVPLPQLDRTWIGSDSYSLHIHQNPGTDPGPTLVCANL